jgi:D-serine deaminase-like pyridoxal phosphate-dependent protein
MSVSMTRDYWLERYRDQLGRARNQVATPALILDLEAAKWNIAAMAEKFRALPAELRPHIKVHKSPELARMQIEAGAIGVACATAWEVLVMAGSGVEDVLLANQLVQPDKVKAVVTAAHAHRITVAVDDVRNVEQLSRAADEAGSELELLIEVDVGMARCGVRSKEEALPLAERIAELPGVRLRGLQGYEGHCMLEPDRAKRVKDAHEANAKVVSVADYLADRDHSCQVISAGGTGTYYITGANPRITEVQAGSYTLMDCFHGNLVPGGFQSAMTVLGSVISRQGNTIVLDCGRKSVGIDHVAPPLADYPDSTVRYYAEEHCLVDFPGAPPVGLGDSVEVLPGYGPTTVNLHDVFHVVKDGVVVDIWPVIPRGSGRPWI